MKNITKEDALEIFKKHSIGQTVKLFSIGDKLPEKCCVHNCPSNCWFILFSDGDKYSIKSSNLICISKSTGKILYDGSAYDEG